MGLHRAHGIRSCLASRRHRALRLLDDRRAAGGVEVPDVGLDGGDLLGLFKDGEQERADVGLIDEMRAMELRQGEPGQSGNLGDAVQWDPAILRTVGGGDEQTDEGFEVGKVRCNRTALTSGGQPRGTSRRGSTRCRPPSSSTTAYMSRTRW